MEPIQFGEFATISAPSANLDKATDGASGEAFDAVFSLPIQQQAAAAPMAPPLPVAETAMPWLQGDVINIEMPQDVTLGVGTLVDLPAPEMTPSLKETAPLSEATISPDDEISTSLMAVEMSWPIFKLQQAATPKIIIPDAQAIPEASRPAVALDTVGEVAAAIVPEHKTRLKPWPEMVMDAAAYTTQDQITLQADLSAVVPFKLQDLNLSLTAQKQQIVEGERAEFSEKPQRSEISGLQTSDLRLPHGEIVVDKTVSGTQTPETETGVEVAKTPNRAAPNSDSAAVDTLHRPARLEVESPVLSERAQIVNSQAPAIIAPPDGRDAQPLVENTKSTVLTAQPRVVEANPVISTVPAKIFDAPLPAQTLESPPQTVEAPQFLAPHAKTEPFKDGMPGQSVAQKGIGSIELSTSRGLDAETMPVQQMAAGRKTSPPPTDPAEPSAPPKLEQISGLPHTSDSDMAPVEPKQAAAAITVKSPPIDAETLTPTPLPSGAPVQEVSVAAQTTLPAGLSKEVKSPFESSEHESGYEVPRLARDLNKDTAKTAEISVPQVTQSQSVERVFEALTAREIGLEDIAVLQTAPPSDRRAVIDAQFVPSQHHIDTSRADMARSVGQQIAAGLAMQNDRPVELTLSPEELGRVRLHMQSNDQGMIVTVQADRQDTLDLMRKNIDSLSRELHEMGYSDVSFSFSQNPNQDQSAQQEATNPDTPPSDTPLPTRETISQLQPIRISLDADGRGLDLRI